MRRIHARRHARLLLSRAGRILAISAGVVLVTFLLIRIIPGDPARAVLGLRATPESLETLRQELDVDRPLHEQLGSYLGDVAQGDLGDSLTRPDTAVTSLIIPHFGVTLALILASVVISLAVGIPLGLFAGLTRSDAADLGVRVSAVVLLSMPQFFVGLLLLLGLALVAGVAPAGGWGTGWPGNLEYLWLPALALSAFQIALVARTVRQAARVASQEPFVEAALARGLPFRTIVRRHILPNSLLPVVTLVGYSVASLIAGAVVVEAVFALPGVGSDLVTAVATRDYTVVQGIALISAVTVVIVNVVTDVVYSLLDPRIRVAR